MNDHPFTNNSKHGNRMPPQTRKLIFILGIIQRSGTNYLFNLLRLHPDLTGNPPWEDFIVHYSDRITDYCAKISSHWKERGGVEQAELIGSLSAGLESFLFRQAGDKSVVTKTPSVRNVENFFTLFPQAFLLIIVRDGRATVESGVRSFGWKYENATRAWAGAAQRILKFDQGFKDTAFACQYRIVKFEELFLHTEIEMKKIFSFLDIDDTAYDFEAANHLAVSGSSQLISAGHEKIGWRPVERTRDFDPLRRWKDWGPSRMDRFNWIAGDSMIRLGYELRDTGIHPRISWLVNSMLDVKKRLTKTIDPSRHKARNTT